MKCEHEEIHQMEFTGDNKEAGKKVLFLTKINRCESVTANGYQLAKKITEL
jgi:hypothetical protein